MRRIGIEIVADYSSVQKAFSGVSRSAKNFDRDLSHTTRGVIAGSGVIRGLGRSLAFASGGFLAFAGVSSIIRNSIQGAEQLEKAQRGLAVAIRHTGGDLAKLKPQYEAVAQGAARYGENQADATVALQQATLLTGNAVKAQHAYREALVISKATGLQFNTILRATAKGQAGITTSLRRYGILVDSTSTGQEQFNTVMGRFAGQAKANTSTIDRFNATWQNTEEILGAALLPTLNKLLSRFTSWLTKMQKSGQLQKDVNRGIHDGERVFHALQSVIHGVDRVTGSFLHTLELLAAFKFASLVAGWSGSLSLLAGKWGLVKGAAIEAQAAETGALGAAGAAGASGVVSRVGQYTGGAAAAATASRFGGISGLGAAAAAVFGSMPDQLPGYQIVQRPDGAYSAQMRGGKLVLIKKLPPQYQISPAQGHGSIGDIFGSIAGGIGSVGAALTRGSAAIPPRPHIFTQQFQLTGMEQLSQAQAGLTRGSADDVAAAKQVVARVKRLIAEGRLKGKAMIQALGLEASALSTIWSAEDAAAQKRAQAAAKAKAKIAAQIQNSIDPLKLEVQLSKDQALRRSTVKDLEALKRAAEKALRSGKLSLEQQKQAWDQIASINQQLEQSAVQSTAQFKQLNTRQLTAGLGLTPEQRKALRARLSQRGPGGTGPGQGTGAYGYTIGQHGRPIHVHNHVHLDGKEIEHSTTRHRQRRRRRNSSQRRGPNAGG